jgi:hypothetical protein
MFSTPRSLKPFLVVLSACILALLLIIGTQFALANRASAPDATDATPDSPTGWGDDGKYEVGVEWMNIFPNPADNRAFFGVSCDGLYSRLASIGWTPGFRFTDYGAWETDFKNASRGGQENIFVDSVDMAMICTHGSNAYDTFHQQNLSAVYFSTTQNDQYLSSGDAYIGYGDKDLEYLAFDACSVLKDSSFIYWASTFNGLHLLLGFINPMHPDPYGDGLLWGYFMTSSYPLTVTQSWFMAINFNQPSWVCARVIGEKLSNYNEYWWNTSPDPSVDSEKWIWDHCSYGIIYGRNNNEQSDVISLPIIQVLDRNVDENYVHDTIAPAFNITGPVAKDDMFYYMANTSGGITLTLLVDPVTGSYSFLNLSKLWTVPVITPTLPTEREAVLLIYNWFNDTPAGNLPGAQYRNSGYFYTPEGIFNELLSTNENGDLQGNITNNIPTDISMTYPRVISITAETLDGIKQANYPIFGPGARTAIYLGDQGEIIGAQGGSRDVDIMADMVDILDSNVVWSMFLANPDLAIGEIPFMADTITHLAPTLGYYEMPYYVDQGELIPVWEFRSYFYQDGDLIADDYPVYLPASASYMPPQVEIINPPDGSTFSAGDLIEFNGSVIGSTPPYSYKWTSSTDGILGDTLDIISAIGAEVKSGEVFITTIALQVTDANGLTSTDMISLHIKPLIWLPAISK